ncbi:MAG: GGDEF domain-containing protein, partial [Synechococcus sp.]|nr:GGDEF domain-containing protein [Synechococcus sp.]
GGLPLPSFRVELQQSHRNGSWVWTDVTGSSIIDEAGVFIGTLLVYRDISERKRLEDELLQRAASDELTGLLNRRALLEQLDALLCQPDRRRADQGLALLFCDLDLFKDINDSLGHAVGDAVLRTTAQRIRCCLRAGDLAARMGGDEIVVVLRDIADLDAAMAIASAIGRTIAEPITTTLELQVAITVSIGVTMARPREGVDELMSRADQGMYQAKQSGRNCVTPIV